MLLLLRTLCNTVHCYVHTKNKEVRKNSQEENRKKEVITTCQKIRHEKQTKRNFVTLLSRVKYTDLLCGVLYHLYHIITYEQTRNAHSSPFVTADIKSFLLFCHLLFLRLRLLFTLFLLLSLFFLFRLLLLTFLLVPAWNPLEHRGVERPVPLAAPLAGGERVRSDALPVGSQVREAQVPIYPRKCGVAS